jgi:KAP family P-loop domain
MTMTSTATPFDGDALNRGVFADNLKNLILRHRQGVIAVDGAWGSGKTWLGQNICLALDQDGEAKVKTVWIDTFDADWADDPALSLLGALAETLQSDTRQKFIESVAPYASKLLLTAGKVGLKAVGKMAGIDADDVDQLTGSIGDASEEYIKKKLSDLADRKNSLTELKSILQKSINENCSKLVIFVDELDRCSPAFAVRFLERIKHLFSLDDVVFVLLWNRTQIQNAVRVFYGEDTDGLMYLDRFIDWSCHLPNHHHSDGENAMYELVERQIQKTNVESQALLRSARSWIAGICYQLKMSAREVNHVCSCISNSRNAFIDPLAMWLIALKIKAPTTYTELREQKNSGHQTASSMLDGVSSSNESIRNFIKFLRQFHLKGHIGDTAAYEELLRRSPRDAYAFGDRDFIAKFEQLELQWR